jgi:hypothetical protein
MCANDLLTNREPKSRALSGRLGRETALEDPRHDLRWNAYSAISDLNLHTWRAGRSQHPQKNADATAIRHRVGRVGKQVHQKSVQLARIANNWWKRVLATHGHLNPPTLVGTFQLSDYVIGYCL